MPETSYCETCEEYVRPLPYGACPGCDESSGLRAAPVPVLARVREDRVLVDVRTLLPGDDEWVEQALGSAVR